MKDSFIKFRVDPIHKTAISAMAEELGLPVSEVCRRAVLNLSVKPRLTPEQMALLKDVAYIKNNLVNAANLYKHSKSKEDEEFRKLLQESAEYVRMIYFKHLNP